MAEHQRRQRLVGVVEVDVCQTVRRVDFDHGADVVSRRRRAAAIHTSFLVPSQAPLKPVGDCRRRVQSGGPAIPLAVGGNGAAPNAADPWGPQRSDETLLTGDAKANVEKAALSKVPGGKIFRIETDADGHAAYEAHMTNAKGTPVTVYVDKQFNVVGVESR